MSTRGRPSFPDTAVEWLLPTPREGHPVLLFGQTCAPIAERLAAHRSGLVLADTTRAGVRSLMRRAPHGIPALVMPERLPFIPGAFDGVMLHQNLHTFAGAAIVQEVARVLAPGGQLGVSWITRDDSVPWVRRLMELVRALDPDAMPGDYGTTAIATLVNSPYFGNIEERRVRLWVPVARVDLLDMVARRFPTLDPGRRAALLADVGQLYESSARAPAPLLLPYQVACWRAEVDHSEFTSAIELPDPGLPIRL
ncbi:MAG: class I SAM-dependent methyltransferase [Propioniciclava sp.]